MIKFNDESLFIGYLKQKLASFNLPTTKVYTKEQQQYHDWYMRTKFERSKKIENLTAEKECWDGIIADDIERLKNPDLTEEEIEALEAEKAEAEENFEIVDKELKELKAITPEKDVLMTVYRNIASDYEVDAMDIADMQRQVKSLKENIYKLGVKMIENQERLDYLVDKENPTPAELEEIDSLPKLILQEEEEQKDSQTRLDEIEALLAKTIKYPERMRYIQYIKDGKIQEYVPKIDNDGVIHYTDNDWKICHMQYGESHEPIHEESNSSSLSVKNYIFGIKDLNHTKNLIIQNSIYDTYTHEYLGDYLRFLRDFKNVNLMPLYNCFSNRVCPKLSISFKVTDDIINEETNEVISEGYTVEFNTDDPNYKIYMVPIKFFQKYTIAIDSGAAIEMCCGLFGQYQELNEKYTPISKQTYACFNNMAFRTPMLYDKADAIRNFLGEADKTELAQREQDLKLFIKVPFKNESSIVVLEGDYTGYNDTFISDTVSMNELNKKRKEHLYKQDARFESMYSKTQELYEYLIKPFILTIERKENTPEVIEQKNRATQILNEIVNIGYLTDSPDGDTSKLRFPEAALDYYTELLKPDCTITALDYAPKIPQSRLDSLRRKLADLEGTEEIPGLNGLLIQDLSKLRINPTRLRESNHTVINFEGNYEELLTKLITPLQLLRTNTGESYPFADRLIEYLTENAITSMEEIYDNIERAKYVTIKNVNANIVPLDQDGLWVPALQAIYYDYINTDYDTHDINHDILGYVDKDVEKLYGYKYKTTVKVNGVEKEK